MRFLYRCNSSARPSGRNIGLSVVLLFDYFCNLLYNKALYLLLIVNCMKMKPINKRKSIAIALTSLLISCSQERSPVTGWAIAMDFRLFIGFIFMQLTMSN